MILKKNRQCLADIQLTTEFFSEFALDNTELF